MNSDPAPIGVVYGLLSDAYREVAQWHRELSIDDRLSDAEREDHRRDAECANQQRINYEKMAENE